VAMFPGISRAINRNKTDSVFKVGTIQLYEPVFGRFKARETHVVPVFVEYSSVIGFVARPTESVIPAEFQVIASVCHPA